MPTSDVVFMNGAVFTGTGEPLRDHAVAVTGGSDHGRGARRRGRRRSIGESTRVVDLNGALLAPGFQDAHIHPVGARRRAAAVQPDRGDGCRSRCRRRAGVRGGQPRGAVDPRRRMVDGPLPRRCAAARACWMTSCPTVRSCCRAATTTARGRTPPRSRRRASTRPRPIRRTAASSARPTDALRAPSTRAPWSCSAGVRPELEPRPRLPGTAARAERAGGTRDHRLAGRHGRIGRRCRRSARRLPARTRRGHPAREGRRCAVVGARGGPRPGRALRRAVATSSRRATTTGCGSAP